MESARDFSRRASSCVDVEANDEPLFHAIVLTIAARGFTPRCARETEGQADPRIVRIAKGLMASKLNAYRGFCDLLDTAKNDALGTLTWPAIVKAAEITVSQMPVA